MQAAIRTLGLIKRYGGRPVVDRIDLLVPSGAIYGFLGPNGAGKTTTVRLLLGLTLPHAGRIELLGRPAPASLRDVGAIIETPTHYEHLTGVENLEISRQLLRLPAGEIDRVLDIVGLRTSARARVGTYSLGMRQRLGLARALLGRPRLLILDEPTNGLDPDGIREMRALIRALPEHQSCTVLLCSHQLAEVQQVATEIGLMWGGRLVRQGRLSDIVADQDATLEVATDRCSEAADLLTTRGFKTEPLDQNRLAVRGAADPAALNALLTGAGFAVSHLAVRELSLEDVYTDLTRTPRLLAACA